MPTIDQLKKLESNPALKEEGVWAEFPLAEGIDALRLKLRSAASNKARTWDLARFRKQRAYYLGDRLPPVAILNQNEIDKLAEVLVVEWNLTDGSVPVPCTVESVRGAMAVLPDVRFYALAETAKLENYRLQEVGGLEKNSETPSSPSSRTGAEGA